MPYPGMHSHRRDQMTEVMSRELLSDQLAFYWRTNYPQTWGAQGGYRRGPDARAAVVEITDKLIGYLETLIREMPDTPVVD